jgi:hypothetical protein
MSQSCYLNFSYGSARRPRGTSRVAQSCIVGAGLALALGAGRDAAIDPILEFLHLTPIGDHKGRPLQWTGYEGRCVHGGS